MKKLIIAAALVAAAIVGQSATVDWNAASTVFVDQNGNTQTSIPSGSIVLVLLSNNTGWDAGTWSASAGSLTELASATIGSGKSKGKISGTTYSFSYNETNPSASALKNGDVLAVVFKDADGNYSQLAYYTSKSAVTDTLTVSGLADNTWATIFNFAQGDAASGGIYAPVPEPTSAMLVLLGFTGLALKRKRA